MENSDEKDNRASAAAIGAHCDAGVSKLFQQPAIKHEPERRFGA
jgi:hypothetical protein